jgi:hypothetical protein
MIEGAIGAAEMIPLPDEETEGCKGAATPPRGSLYSRRRYRHFWTVRMLTRAMTISRASRLLLLLHSP